MMNKTLKTKWVRALRSGRYKQGKEHLRIDAVGTQQERFCCLGVLCEVAGMRRGKVGYWIGKQRAIDTLPYKSKLHAQIGGSDNSDILVDMNDGNGSRKRRSFRGIAQWIERNL